MTQIKESGEKDRNPQVKLGMISNHAMVAFAILLGSSVEVFSSEPLQGVRHNFDGSEHYWQLDDGRSMELTVFIGQSKMPIARYDLTDFLFCSGTEDNCESDGVVELNLASQPTEPILAVACHIGAHSQLVEILAPWRNDSEAVFSISGAYHASYLTECNKKYSRIVSTHIV